ncbi:MAG: hypothetical protein HUU55_08130 [Myxococcales bacterium]|nr:hypothetical protein [Myxococcales bacterium]
MSVGLPVSMGPLVANLVADHEIIAVLPRAWLAPGRSSTWTVELRSGAMESQAVGPVPAVWVDGCYQIQTPFVIGHVWPSDHAATLTLVSNSCYDVGLRRKTLSALRLCCLLWLADNNGVGLHGSSGIVEGKAVGFLGKSGMGKTTAVTRFMPPTILGDDFLAIRWVDGQYCVFGTPFSGREGLPAEDRVAPLRTLAVIRPGKATEMAPLGQSDRIPTLVRHTFLVTDNPTVRRQTLQFLANLAGHIPIYQLQIALSESPWTLPELTHG